MGSDRESVELQQFEIFFAKLSKAEKRERHQYLLARQKKQRQIARNAKRVFSRYLSCVQVDVNQEFGRQFILQAALFHEPEKAWGDPVAMREHRKNPIWILAWKSLEPMFRQRKLSVAQAKRLTDFALPAFWIQLSETLSRKEKPEACRSLKEENAKLREFAALEKLAEKRGEAETLRYIETAWPRNIKEVWAGKILYGERRSPTPLSWPGWRSHRKKGRPQRPLVHSLRRASLKALTEWNFTKSEASCVVDEMETILGVSQPLYVGHDGYGKPYRIDAILKSQ